MARGSSESTSDLYIRLGLSTNEFESGFVDAERTLHDNMARLNREMNLVDLRAQVEINGLDETADQMQILTIRTRSLDEQIRLQQDRIRLASASLQQLTQSQGASATATQNMEARLRREQLALQRLEQQLRRTQQAQENLNNTSSSSNAGGAAGNSGDVGGLEVLVDGVLERIPPQAKIAASAIAGLGLGIKAAGTASADLIREWEELQKQSYELNMSVNDTENFLRHMKLAGGDIGDFEGFIRGISDAMVKGEWDDPEAMVFRKYGETAFDENGRIKGFQEMTETIKRMYDQAKAAGEEIEFLQMLGGESGIRDAIQYLERYDEAKEDAAKIFDAGLDPEEFHEAERALNLLTEQIGEFKDAAVNLVTPTTTAAMKTFFNVFHEGTEFLTENNEALHSWIDTFAKAAVDAAGLRPILTHFSDNEDTQKLDNHTKKVLQAQDNLNKAYAKQKIQMQGDPTTQYGWQRLNDLRDELRELEIELDNFGNSYDEALAKVDLWREKSLRQSDLSKQERIAVEELYAAKVEQIEQEKEDKLEEIRESVNSHFQTGLQNQIDAIEKQKQDWINIGMEEAEAETLAQRLKADAISKLNAEMAEKLDSIWQTSLERRLAEIEKEKQAWIQKGIDEVKATQWAEQAKADAQKSAAMEVLKNNLKEYRAFQDGGYEGLKNYKLNQLAKSGIHVSDLDMTPQQLADFQKAQKLAQNSLLPNFMTDTDRKLELPQKLKSEIAEQERRRAKTEEMAAGIMVDGKVTDPKILYDMFGAISDEALEDLKQQLENASAAAENFRQQLDAETPAENIDAPFEDLTSKIENVNSSFEDLTPTIENISTNFEDISATLENLSNEFDNLTSTLENLNGNFENLSAVLENIERFEEKPEQVDTPQNFEAIPPFENISNSFGELTTQITDTTSTFNNLSEKLKQLETPQLPQTETPATPLNINDLISVFDVIKPTLENLNGNFSGLLPQIENASNYFGGLSENALNATAAFSNLAERINALDLSQKSAPEITNNISIKEAHAWDYSHIQELAEKVADVITPKILAALGGGLNGY